jgi:hypothetical protein
MRRKDGDNDGDGVSDCGCDGDMEKGGASSGVFRNVTAGVVNAVGVAT